MAGRSRSAGQSRRQRRADIIGRPTMNEKTGLVARPSRRNLDKWTAGTTWTKSSSQADHALAIANADALFRTAVPVVRYPDPRGQPGLQISRWRAYLQTPNGVRGVKMTVKETAHPDEPNPLYTIEAMEVEPTHVSPKPGRNLNFSPVSPDRNIVRLSDGFNRDPVSGVTKSPSAGTEASRHYAATMRRVRTRQNWPRKMAVPAAVLTGPNEKRTFP